MNDKKNIKDIDKITRGVRYIPATFKPILKELFTDKNISFYFYDILSNIINIKINTMKNNIIIKDNYFVIDDLKIIIIIKNLLGDDDNLILDYKSYKLIQIKFNKYITNDKKIITKYLLLDAKTKSVIMEKYYINLLNLGNNNLNLFEKELSILITTNPKVLDKIVENDKKLKMVQNKIKVLSSDNYYIELYKSKILFKYYVKEKIAKTKLKSYNRGINHSKKQIALMMFKDNIPINLITKYTSIPLSFIKKIDKQ